MSEPEIAERTYKCTCGAFDDNQKFIERVKILWREEKARNAALLKQIHELLAKWPTK